ncbi:MAG: ABC transporter substrate-binding protein [Bifidobacterium subtile]|jgi:branched-chain amino acid transport system substrate-binding protein|nr:ABC transporter substrate-binding protein [Bifidobacterium subtile]MCI1242175.1 ABC transporter substrate-binding protein [Bifidobacterium subtile]MCI1258895.1 ABC transporter substrate-binding protein [Bifidobacterium subtile]
MNTSHAHHQRHNRSQHLWRKWAAAGVSLSLALSLFGCGASSSGDSSSGGKAPFLVGGLFPQTGSLSYFGPPETAAFKLAEQDINKAGGVLGTPIKTATADVNDADHADQNQSATNSLLSKNPSVIVGNPSSGVVKNTYSTIAAAQVPLISVGATATSLSGISPYFFRTVPPDSVQGAVLADTIAQDGVRKLAIASFNDEAGNGMRDVVSQRIASDGVDVVYGKSESFDPVETDFAPLAATIKASKPDAVLVIAFVQTIPLVKQLISAGIDPHKLYFFDGNTADYSKDFAAGTLKGNKGTIPGAHASAQFQKRLKAIDSSLTSFTYTAETYDAVVLSALAAQKGGASDPATVHKNLPAVSGSQGGQQCGSYADCLALLKDDKEIAYHGQSGVGPFNKKNDPSSAYIGIYAFDGDNRPVFDHAQQGKTE